MKTIGQVISTVALITLALSTQSIAAPVEKAPAASHGLSEDWGSGCEFIMKGYLGGWTLIIKTLTLVCPGQIPLGHAAD